MMESEIGVIFKELIKPYKIDDRECYSGSDRYHRVLVDGELYGLGAVGVFEEMGRNAKRKR